MLSSNYQIKEPKTPAFTQIITRAGIFSGLSFKQTKESDIKKTNYLTSVPNISFSFDKTTVIIDYGESKNFNDRELVKSLFAYLNPGSVFTITQGNYTLEDEESSADLSGTYTFVKLIGHAIIATPLSVNSINNRISIYQNKNFISIPQIGTSVNSKTNLIYYTITNSLLSDKINSFTNFGIYPNDFIKISGTKKNDKIYKVLSVNNNSDGSETLIVENEISDEVCFGLPLSVQLIQNGPYTLAGLENNSSQIVGSCSLQFSDTVSCYRNHTETQCSIRGSEKSAISVTWVEGATCGSTSQLLNTQVSPVRVLSKVATNNVANILTRQRPPNLGTTEIPSVAE